MSKAYHAVKNFTFKEIMNLACYGAKHPETLTSSQRITRLYRACIRKLNQSELERLQGDLHRYDDYMFRLSKDFYRLNHLNINYPNLSIADKQEFTQLETKWVEWQKLKYDTGIYVEECRPYSPSSGRYYTYPDEQLAFDPFGYYSNRLLSDNRPSIHLPYFEDYPLSDTRWDLDEQIPEEFDTSNSEYAEVQSANERAKQ